ncbi:MAG: hypothetical protein OHK006_15550 [Thermodesulfovibrionales bacterium]
MRDTMRSLAAAGSRFLKNVLLFDMREYPSVTSLSSQTLGPDDVELAKAAMKNHSGWSDPDVVTRYESAFAQWNGSRHAYAFMGGRVALSACIHALDLKPGDEVIMPGYTCVVVPNAFHYAGVRVVYSDIELETYGLDVTRLESRITPRTRAILLQHLYGLVCRDYEAVLDLAKQHGLKVIEDCAHAAGAVYKGMNVGNRGDIAFYSSNRTKVFSTVEGGMAVTNDDGLAARLGHFYSEAPSPEEELIEKLLKNVLLDYYSFTRSARSFAKAWTLLRYGDQWHCSTSDEEMQGRMPSRYIARMPAPLAALGLNQLGKLDRYNEQRRLTARRWDAWCEAHGYAKPRVVEGSTPIFLRYPVLVEPEKKRDTSWAEREFGIELGIWFSGNLHPVNIRLEDCPNADRAVKQCINFPTLLS